jgi:hypothetical protein
MRERKSDPIRIDTELYLRVREHCDRTGIRFLDFVENALEEAMADESAAEVLGREVEKLRRKTATYDYAFSRGFQRGFSFLALVLGGMGMPPEMEEDLETVRTSLPAIVPGEQLKLF